MALADTVATQLAAIQTGETAVLTGAITQAFADGAASVPATGGISSDQEASDIAAAVGPLNTQIAALQQQLSDLSTAKAVDDTVIQGLQASVTQIQALATQLAAIVIPAPPVPVPVPTT